MDTSKETLQLGYGDTGDIVIGRNYWGIGDATDELADLTCCIPITITETAILCYLYNSETTKERWELCYPEQFTLDERIIGIGSSDLLLSANYPYRDPVVAHEAADQKFGYDGATEDEFDRDDSDDLRKLDDRDVLESRMHVLAKRVALEFRNCDHRMMFEKILDDVYGDKTPF